MATLTDIVLGTTDVDVASTWYVRRYRRDDVAVRELWHYSHRMLVWNANDPTDPEVLDYGIGWGSKSDQKGMNQVFRALGIPLYFQRSIQHGGPQILETDPANATRLRDSYLEMREKFSWVR